MKLKNKDLVKILQGTKIPVYYGVVKRGTGLPYLVIRQNGINSLKADDFNYYDEANYILELYASTKDFDIEERIEAILDKNYIVYDKSEDIRDEVEDFYIIYYYI